MQSKERPQLATPYIILMSGFMLCALLFTLYYLFSIQVGTFTAQTQTLRAGGTIVVLISGFCAIGIMCALRFNILSFPIIFVGSCFTFNLGKFVFMILEDINQVEWYLPAIPSRYYIEALPVAGLSFTALLLGVIVAALANEKRRILYRSEREPLDLENDSVRVLRHIGYALYTFSILLILYYTLQGTGLALAIQYGYSGAGDGYASAQVAGKIPVLSTAALFWFAPWSTYILLTTARKGWEQFFVLILAVGTCGLTLLAGDRFVPVSIFLSIMSIAHLRGQKLNLFQVGIVLFIIFFIVSTWVRIRTVSIKEWDLELFTDATIRTATGEYQTDDKAERQFKYPVSRVFNSMGQSYLILPGTMKLIDDGEPYHYGVDYIRMMGAGVPLTGSLFAKWSPTPSEWFDDQYINADSLWGLGFSLVAEAYLQGGVLAVIIVHFILGFTMTAVWFFLERRPRANLITYITIIISSIYIWVRNDMTEIAKPSVWGFGLIFIIPFVIVHALRQTQRS